MLTIGDFNSFWGFLRHPVEQNYKYRFIPFFEGIERRNNDKMLQLSSVIKKRFIKISKFKC